MDASFLMLNLRKKIFLMIEDEPYISEIWREIGSSTQVYKVIYMFMNAGFVNITKKGAKKFLSYTPKGKKIREIILKLEEVLEK